MTLFSALKQGEKTLKSCGIDSAVIDSQVLMMNISGFTRNQLFVNNELELNSETVVKYDALIQLRAKHMPVQYIVNSSEFMSLPFYVDKNVLIPRPDTEVLVETVIAQFKQSPSLGIDIGTGSGCIAVSIAYYCKNCTMAALDINADSLAVAERNARNNNVSDRITFVSSDLLSDVPKEFIGNTDFIVSNPPYIPSGQINLLEPNVRDYEPHIALDGGSDGLDFYRAIASEAKWFLRKGGKIYFEAGYGQAADISKILKYEGFSDIIHNEDLSGIERCVCATL